MGTYFNRDLIASMSTETNNKIRDLVDCSKSVELSIGAYKEHYYDDILIVYHQINYETISMWKMHCFPSASGVVIFSDVFVRNQYRSLGIGTLCHQLRLNYAKAIGAKLALCTVNNENIPEIKILNKFDWSVVNVQDSFSMWQKNL